MKKIIPCLLAVLLITAAFCGCGKENTKSGENDGQKLQIVITIFPTYDWTRQILGEKADYAELTLLLDNGVDIHSFQPTTDDIIKISSCDMFIYTGGESDSWVEDALATATNKDIIVVNLLEVLGDAVKVEEIVEGMEHEHAHEDEDEHEHGAAEPDEHVWLSLRHAQTLCGHIADKLAGLDSENAGLYRENAAAYQEHLAELDKEYQAVLGGAPQKTLLFADRFPFRYLADDYSLGYFAAFSGCSAETEASFETVIFLAEKVNDLGLDSVLIIEASNQSIAKTVVENTAAKDQKILALDSLESGTSSYTSDYLSIMRNNLNVLKEALY